MSGGFHRRAIAHRRNETRALRLMSNVEVKSGTGPAAKNDTQIGDERAGRARAGVRLVCRAWVDDALLSVVFNRWQVFASERET